MRIRVLLAAAIATWGAASTALAEVPQIIGDNVAAAELRKRMIREAGPGDEVFYTTYNFYLDEPVKEMVRLLGDLAAKRRKAGRRAGITVVVDGHFVDPTPGSGGYQAYLSMEWLASQGVQAYVYNPLQALAPGASSLAKLWINHRKFLVVGSSVLIGSRNAGAYHLADFHHSPNSNFIDADIYLPRGAAPGISASAASLIHDMISEPSALRIEPRVVDPGALQLASAVKFAPERIWGNALEGTYDWRFLRTDWATGLDAAELARALADCAAAAPELSGCGRLFKILLRDTDRDEFRRAVRQAIHDEQGGGEILIESPYFYPDPSTLHELTRAIRRGVRFHLITNSVYSSGGASKLILLYLDPYFNQWIKEGGDRVKIEFSTDHNIHAKTFSFRSQKLFFVGSHNLHARSGLFDTEAGVSFRADREDFMNLRTWYYLDFETTRCKKEGHTAQILIPYSPIDLKALQHVLDMLPEATEWVGAPAAVNKIVRGLATRLRGSNSLAEFQEKPGEWRITRAHRYALWVAEVKARAVVIRAAFGALEPLVGPFL